MNSGLLYLNIKTPIKFSIVSKITEDSYAINIDEIGNKSPEQVYIAVIFKDLAENMWNLVCNSGKFKCNAEGNIQMEIPNTGRGKHYSVKKNYDLFNKEFEEYDYTQINFIDFTDEQFEELVQFTDYMISQISKKEKNIERKYIPYYMLTDSLTKQAQINYGCFTANSGIFNSSDFYQKTPTYDFMENQIKFNRSLNSKEQSALLLYSKNGDQLLNMYIRNNRKINEEMLNYYNDRRSTFDNYSLNANLKDLLEDFYFDLKLLFEKAPPVDKDFIVYRGVKSINHFNGTTDNIYINRGIVSTTINPDIAIQFSEGKYMSIIHVPVGAKIIYNYWTAYYNEIEFILPDSTYFLVTKPFQPFTYISRYRAVTQGWNNADIEIMTNECVILQ